MKIFANHAHVFRSDVWEDGTVDVLRRTLDQCGIERCVCFATFFERGIEYDSNRWLAAEIKNHDELAGFGVIDFTRQNLAEQVQEIADLGFRGIKMHPAYQKFKVDDARAFEVYQKAEELGLFISFHTGVHWHRIRDYQVLLFDEVAYHFKNLRFSMEHVGGYSFFNEAIAVLTNNNIGKRKNVYAGLTSVFDPDINRLWYLDEKKINDLFNLVGVDMCVFGLDFPYNNAQKISEAIASVQSMNISDEAKEKILGKNLDFALYNKKCD